LSPCGMSADDGDHVTMELDLDDLIHRLRSIGQAYPEDVFPPLSSLEIKQHSAIVSQTAGAMGRHIGKIMIEIADEIEKRISATNPPRGSPPFPEAEAAGGGSNSPCVSDSAGASPE
jgi:hypothetical protein